MFDCIEYNDLKEIVLKHNGNSPARVQFRKNEIHNISLPVDINYHRITKRDYTLLKALFNQIDSLEESLKPSDKTIFDYATENETK